VKELGTEKGRRGEGKVGGGKGRGEREVKKNLTLYTYSFVSLRALTAKFCVHLHIGYALFTYQIESQNRINRLRKQGTGKRKNKGNETKNGTDGRIKGLKWFKADIARTARPIALGL